LRNFGDETSLTLSAAQTVHGAGRISGSLKNQGTVNANVAARVLEVLATTSNEGHMLATAGGLLNIAGETVTQTGSGRILASGDGSTVNFANATVIDGPMGAEKGGLL